jgi:hypothetical protein
MRALAVLLTVFLLTSAPAAATTGQVLDAGTGQPIASAQVTIDDEVVLTDANGIFRSTRTGDTVRVRARGYRREEVAARALAAPVRLVRFSPRAVYLSVFGIGHKALRTTAFELIETTELNAVVIDVKGDAGLVSYRSAVPLATEIGAQATITIPDLRTLLAGLRQKGIYTIARLVVFKDNPLAEHRRDLAIKAGTGRLWRDREGLAWVDPFRREVSQYNIALAVEAASHGFDEIQFDYVRFPDAQGLAYAQASTATSRVRAIDGFLAEARRRLAPYNVFLAADVFGYVCWNLDDTGVGQTLGTLAAHLDYVSPMVYPSSFQFGIPGYRNPVSHPYEIVSLTLGRARERTGLPPVHFRPWLQAFRDYAFDRRPFGATEIRAQIDAAERFGSNGWMLWNPRNVYSREGLKPDDAPRHRDRAGE